MDLTRLKAIKDQQAKEQADRKRDSESRIAGLDMQETVVKSFARLVEYLDGKTSRTLVVNQIKDFATHEDAQKFVSALDSLHTTLKTHENTDLTEITGVMKAVLAEAKKIPKEHPKEKEEKFIDYTKQMDGLLKAVKAVEQVVKNQKLIAEAPVINVPETTVNVEAPDLKPLQTSIKDVVSAVKDIVIPEYTTDNQEVEKLLKLSNKLLKSILEKPVGGGGGGGGRATPYQDTSGMPVFPNSVVSAATPTITAVAVVNPDGSNVGGSAGDLHTQAKGATAAGYPTSTTASVDRQLLDVTLRDTSGAAVALGGGTQYIEDVASATDPTGTVPILIRKDTPATITSTDGDNIAQRATNYGAAYTQIVTSAGAFVDTFGGGTQYADAVARGTATGTLAMGDDGTNIQSVHVDSAGDLQIDVLTSALPTGAATSALQTQPGVDIGDVTINNASGGSAVNIQDGGNSITVDGAVTTSGTVTEANSAAILTSTQLLDDTVATLGTTTYTEATTKGNVIGAVRRDANTTLVDTTNEVAPLQVNSTGELKVAQIQALPTGANVIGALTANQSVNVAQVNGITPLMGNGVTGTGSNRVTLASDGTAISTTGYMSVKVDQTTPGTTNATSIAQLGANTVATGNGASSTGVLRVAQVNDGTGVLAGVTTVSTVTSVAQNADVRQATASNLNAQVVGTVAHDGVDSGNPLKVGGKARQTNPTAVADLDRVDATFDDIGRQVVVLNQVRDLEVHQTTTITASTAETTILTAGAAGVFHDITLITIANTSATATRVDIRDATAGSVIWSMYVPAGQQIGANITVPIKQTTAANNWTATCITSLTDLRIFVQGVKNV
jgi:hypothetical protein